MSNIWYTSDHHFGHYNIIRMCNRPYQSTDEMDADLVAKFNARVKPDDTVYIVGDVAMHQPSGLRALDQMNGKKHLIVGNHDCNKIKNWPGWISVREYVKISDGGVSVVLFHYPIHSWDGQYRGTIHLHGHSHSPKPQHMFRTNRFDVGVDANLFEPVSLSELLR